MGAQDVLSRKTGVIVGDDVLALFKHAREHEYAIPAINVTSSSTVVAALEAARDAKSPVILQTSQGGAAYFAGKGVSNTDQKASIAGAIAAAHYIRAIAPAYDIPVVLHTDHCAKKLLPWLDGMLDADEAYFKKTGEPLFSSHMIDLSEEEVQYNIDTTAAYLKRAAPMKQWLEMEIGITGGEEDGVNNEDVDNNSLYTQPEDILAIVKALEPISPYFSIAAGFGNVHGKRDPSASCATREYILNHSIHRCLQARQRQAPPRAARKAPGVRQEGAGQEGGQARLLRLPRRLRLQQGGVHPGHQAWRGKGQRRHRHAVRLHERHARLLPRQEGLPDEPHR